MSFQLTSTAFTEGRPIPAEHTGDDADTSPPLTWSGQPQETACFVLLCEDSDAPRGIWTHWVLFNLPAASDGLPERMPNDSKLDNGAIQGKNDFGKLGYGGPAPPPGKPHHYFFRLYALDSLLQLEAGVTRQQVLAAMKGHVLAETHLMGTYQR